jgi:hypothetical protein
LEGKRAGEPTLAHIVRETTQLLALFEEAQERGLISGSESERLPFVATAERARVRAVENAEGLFAELVRRRLWHFVTQDDRRPGAGPPQGAFLRRPGRGRALVMKCPSGALSRDALFVADVTAKLRRKGFVGDIFSAVSLHLPDWTRERWQSACAEIEDAKKNRAGDVMSRAADFSLLSSLQVR